MEPWMGADGSDNKDLPADEPKMPKQQLEAVALTNEGGGAPPDINRRFELYTERIEQLDVSTPTDGAVFYSREDPVFHDPVFNQTGEGVTWREVLESGWGGHDANRIRSQDIAESYARQTGKQTVGMTEGGKWLQEHMPDDLDDKQVKQLWARLSERFAEGASGEVVAFSRAHADDTEAIWIDKEYPALKANPNVTHISIIGMAERDV